MEITAENAELKAKEFYELSYKLGETINEIDMMGRLNWQAIRDEPEAYETIILEGENIINALRQIALRLDRSVLCKMEDN